MAEFRVITDAPNNFTILSSHMVKLGDATGKSPEEAAISFFSREDAPSAEGGIVILDRKTIQDNLFNIAVEVKKT